MEYFIFFLAFCPYIIEGNAEWNRTIFDLSETINGRCLDGFEGNVSRTCGGVDHFDWSPLNNICEGNFFFFFLHHDDQFLKNE